MASEIERLAAEAAELLEVVDRLGSGTVDRLTKLAKVARTNRRLIFGLIVSLVLEAVLTGLLAFGFVSIHENTEQIQNVTHRLDVSQTVQRQKALCPLYSLFISVDTPKARAAAPDKAVYDKNFRIIHEGYDALRCSDFTGGAPTLGK